MSKSLIREAPARPGPVTELIWLDSVGNGGWGPRKDHTCSTKDMLHRSVGYLLEESDLAVTIVQSIGGTDNLDHSMTIPKVAVVRRTPSSRR